MGCLLLGLCLPQHYCDITHHTALFAHRSPRGSFSARRRRSAPNSRSAGQSRANPRQKIKRAKRAQRFRRLQAPTKRDAQFNPKTATPRGLEISSSRERKGIVDCIISEALLDTEIYTRKRFTYSPLYANHQQ